MTARSTDRSGQLARNALYAFDEELILAFRDPDVVRIAVILPRARPRASRNQDRDGNHCDCFAQRYHRRLPLNVLPPARPRVDRGPR